MKHYGDISSISGSELEPVDLITGGSPCQDMSVAGKRKGMSKECPKCGYKSIANEDTDICPECGSEMQYTRSGLFMEQIRIIKEMREADERNGRSDQFIRPRFMLWENVVGAFSSNKGEDFRAVLEETAKVKDKTATIPRPPKGKWNTEGCIVGDGWSIAWRVLDAQFWGVPQRRRRIALVADFAGQCAGEILFKRKGLSRNFTESRKSWQATSGDTSKGIDASSEHCIGFEPGAATRTGGHTYDNQTGSLRANMGDNQFCVAKEEQYAVDFGRVADRIQMNATKAVTLQGLGGGSGAKTGLYCLPKDTPPVTMQVRCGNPVGGGKGALLQINKSATLSCGVPQTLFDPIPIQYQAISNGMGNGLGVGKEGEPMYSLMSETNHGVCCLEGNGSRPSHRGDGYKESETMYTLNATEQHAVAYGFEQKAFGKYDESGKASCLKSRDYKDATDLIVEPSYIVRRLTPVECARLQGFYDWWLDGLETEEPTEEDIAFWREVFETHRNVVTGAKKPKTDKQIIKWLQNPYSDGAAYKLWGNGIALPCFLYVVEGIKEVLDRTSNE
jgi:DNA (cytosine-5)-methyltransferase 1